MARELVENLGVSTRRAAGLVGLAPSAVSQYLGGKRRQAVIEEIGGRTRVTAIVRRAAARLSQTPKGTEPALRIVLETTLAVVDEVTGGGPSGRTPVLTGRADRAALRQLRGRVAAEQAAVTACMNLAQKARDELTRAIFRQIAADSLRHAEIVASLAIYLEAGTSRSEASGIRRSDVEELIRREHEAESGGGGGLGFGLGGVMKLLADSMADDEAKHERLLKGLLDEGLP